MDGAADAGGVKPPYVCFPRGAYWIPDWQYTGPWPPPAPVVANARVSYLDAFCIDQHEVTVGEVRACIQAGVCSPPCLTTGKDCDVRTCKTCANGADGTCLPVQCDDVSQPSKAGQFWTDDGALPARFVGASEANQWCSLMRKGGRLPTLEQWTVASAAKPPGSLFDDTVTFDTMPAPFPWGDEWPPGKSLHTAATGPHPGPKPAATRPTNAAGIAGMMDNVSEHLLHYSLEATIPFTAGHPTVAGANWKVAWLAPAYFHGRVAPFVADHESTGFRCVWLAP